MTETDRRTDRVTDVRGKKKVWQPTLKGDWVGGGGGAGDIINKRI